MTELGALTSREVLRLFASADALNVQQVSEQLPCGVMVAAQGLGELEHQALVYPVTTWRLTSSGREQLERLVAADQPQLDLRDPEARPLPAQQHSLPSIEAATGSAALRRRQDHRRIIAALDRGAKTDRELQAELELPGSTERPRRVELVRAGIVRPVGYRESPNGRRSTVWGLLELEGGLAELEQRLATLRATSRPPQC